VQTNQGQTGVPAISTQQPAVVMNCEYKIPTDMKVIDKSLVLSWSQKATVQAFEFDPTTIDSQMEKLKSCFTEQGWACFNAALQKSGNIEAIKSQKLTVSSQVDGQATVTDAQNNQWKLSLPLQVVYQNDKEKVTQLLNVNLTVGRKITGDFGITQMIATPRTTVTMQQPKAVTNSAVETTTQGNSNQEAPPVTNEKPNTNTTGTPDNQNSQYNSNPTAPASH
jgi:hypothetical protein